MSKTSYSIKDGLENMDFQKVTAMLSKAFWCPDIGMEEVLKGSHNSALVTWAFLSDGNQIGFARVISDKTRFAYIMDVIIDENFRKMGIGQEIIKHILNHRELRDVYQWLLITKDAHEVYRKTGFSIIKRPGDWMEIRYDRPAR